MAAALISYGAGVSVNAESFRAALQQTQVHLDESKVAELMVAVLPRSDQSAPWNLEVVADVLSQECRNFNWLQLAQRLDNPGLMIRGETDFRRLLTFFTRISGTQFPGQALLGIWSNRPAQLVLLLFASNAMMRNLVDFGRMVREETLIEGVPIPQNVAWCVLPFYNTMLELANRGHYNEVVQTMLEASEAYPEYVTCFLAQAQDPNNNARAEVLRRALPKFTGLAGSRNTSLTVMRKLQETNPDLLVLLFRMGFKRSMSVQDIVERHNILQSSGPIIFRRLEEEGLPDELLGYWCVQADRANFPLEDKINATLSANPQIARMILQFLKQHVGSLRSRESEGGLLSIENFGLLFRMLQPYSGNVIPIEDMRQVSVMFQHLGTVPVGSHMRGEIGHAQLSLGTNHPPLQNSRVIDESRDLAHPADEIENESNINFQRVYKGEMSVADCIGMLKRYKSSSEQREQEIFRFMIHILFDEVRFFHKYPDKELTITASLFGSLISNHLVSSITLGIALRYVVEALHKDPERGGTFEKLFRFGRTALEVFRSRLSEWPQYCAHIVQIPHFQRFAPHLYEDSTKALNSGGVTPLSTALANREAAAAAAAVAAAGGPLDLSSLQLSINTGPNRPNAPPMPSAAQSLQMASMAMMSSERSNSLDAYSSPQGSAFNPIAQTGVASISSQVSEIDAHPRSSKPSIIDEMVKVNIEAQNAPSPLDAIKDQIHFIVNNIAANNVDSKVLKLRELLAPDCFVWFANYLVTKRISQQPNLHPLYLNVLETFDSPQLFKDILDSTYFNVTKLLQSPNITSSSSERSLLRNLGIWLGQVTLGRNKPILQRRLNLKELLFWGYETGRLIAVCSFVAKTVEGVRESKVFRPPNPWLMALLGVMRDLYEVEELKMNIKFEVQVLCKNVSIRIEDVPRGNALGQLRVPNKDKNPDFTVKSITGTPSLPGSGIGGAFPTSKPEDDLKATDQPVIPNLASYVVVNSSIMFFTQNPVHRRIVPLAVDRAIREIIQPVVDRSAQVACVSTKHVVLKDFANETSEQLMRNAAHLMVSQLAGSLSIVTCKEPLRVSMVSNLRSLLAQSNVTDAQIVEQILQVCSNDNLDLGCALIEKAAMEKAIRDIDEALQVSYAARRKCRDTGQLFSDPIIARQAGAKFPNELPDALKVRPTGLIPHQIQVYDGFNRHRLQAASIAAEIAEKNAAGQVMLNPHHALEAYQMILQRIDMALKNVAIQAQGREVSISMLPGDHEILSLLRDMIIVTQRTQPAVRMEASTTFAETIFRRMCETVALGLPDLLRLEVLVGCIEALRDACGDKKKFGPDLPLVMGRYGSFNVNDDTSRKLHRAMLLLLLRAKLMRSQDIDAHLANAMDGGRNMVWVEIALSFVRQCLQEGVAATQEFVSTFDTVSKMRPTNAAVRKQLQKWLTDLRTLAASKEEQKAAAAATPPITPAAAVLNARDATVREHVSALLDRWLRVSQSNMNDQVFAQYLHLMHQFGVLKTEEAADRFFRVAVELCVEACLKTAIPYTPDNTPQGMVPYPQSMNVNMTVIDALSKLFLLLVRLADKESGDIAARVNLLSRILNAVVRTLIEDHESKKARRESFDQRPYHRLFSNLSQDLVLPDLNSEPNPAVLALVITHMQAYVMMLPTQVPAFAFSWLSLISNRHMMPVLLLSKDRKGWPYVHRLLLAQLLFLQPFLKTVQLTESVRRLYKGTLRVMLVVLHDFPEFFSEYYISFCDVIPSTCVQMRNLVLSAFPKTMRLPDPFTPNLKIDMIPEVNSTPRFCTDSLPMLASMRQRLDMFLQSRQPADFPSLLPQVLAPNGVYNLQLLNTLVMYLGIVSSAALGSVEQLASADILRQLAHILDPEGRYMLISAMCNQLRYPNTHTRFFSVTLLNIFVETEQEFLQEQITRVLLERLIVHRPHPVCLLLALNSSFVTSLSLSLCNWFLTLFYFPFPPLLKIQLRFTVGSADHLH